MTVRGTSSASYRSGPEPREWHYGQRHMISRTHRSDTWPHQPAMQGALITLANGEPSTHGPLDDSRCRSIGLVGQMPPIGRMAEASHKAAGKSSDFRRGAMVARIGDEKVGSLRRSADID